MRIADALDSLKAAPGALSRGPKGETLHVGSLPRTIVLSPDQRYLYAALHGSGELAQVDLQSFKVTRKVSVSARPVGLDVSPDGRHVGLTSQGGLDKSTNPPGYAGGNSFEIYELRR